MPPAPQLIFVIFTCLPSPRLTILATQRKYHISRLLALGLLAAPLYHPPALVHVLTLIGHPPIHLLACQSACEPLGSCKWLLVSPLILVVGRQQEIARRCSLNDVQSWLSDGNGNCRDYYCYMMWSHDVMLYYCIA